MKKIKGLYRLLAISFAFVNATSFSVFASESASTDEYSDENMYEEINEVDVVEEDFDADPIDNEYVLIGNDGSISYESRITTNEDLLYELDNGVVILNNVPADEQVNNSAVSTYAGSGLQPVSAFSYTFAPCKNMCLISADFPDGTGMNSSGILIAKNLVLASGHGVYNHEHGGAATSVKIEAGAYYSGSSWVSQQGVVYWQSAVVSEGWVNDQLRSGDWSLIILPSDSGITSYQTVGYVADFTQAKGKDITLIGYPELVFSYSAGQITGTTNTTLMGTQWKNLWTTSATSAQGMSGGPVLQDADKVVIGVVEGSRNIIGTNLCVPLTKEIGDIILQHAVW